MPRYDVHLMTPCASWEGVRAENERYSIDLCEPGTWPDPLDGPTSYLIIEVETVAEGEECPHCGEDRVDWLIWDTGTMEIECQSCESVYSLLCSQDYH